MVTRADFPRFGLRPPQPLRRLRLFNEFRLEAHLADARHLAIDVVIALNQPDPAHLGADLDRRGRAFDLEVLDDDHGISVRQQVANAVAHDARVGRRVIAGPFIATLGTDQKGVHFVGEGRRTGGAWGKTIAHAAIYNRPMPWAPERRIDRNGNRL